MEISWFTLLKSKHLIEDRALAEWIAVFITYTASVIGLVLWLANRFRALEKVVYKETNGVKNSIEMLNRRIMRLELKAFGFTRSGQDNFQSIDPDSVS